MRLIDADALMDVINHNCYPVKHDMTSIEPGMTLMGILQAVQEQPTIEPDKRTEEHTETHACDCISRAAAIEALDALCDRECEYSKKQRSVMCGACHLGSAFDVVEQLPSAQPERLTDDDFETIRIHLNAYKEKLCNQQRWKEAEEYQRIIDRFMAFASAQPKNRMERDVISRQAAIKAFKDFLTIHDSRGVEYLCPAVTMDGVNKILSDLPSAQPEIIYCKKCEHWTRTYGDEQWGLGDCDVFDKHLVQCNGYCAWAERRTDG